MPTYLTLVPPPPLDQFIENLWYWEGGRPQHGKDTIMASGRMGLLINLAEDQLHWYGGKNFTDCNRMGGAAIAGPNSRSFAIDAFQAKFMGVQFRVGGAFPFLGGAVHEFHNHRAALNDAWGRDAEELYQRLVAAPTPGGKFETLLKFLVDRMSRPPARHPAVALALDRFSRAPHRAKVGAVVREAEVSTKRFIQLFTDEVGFTPKLYLRIARFQRTLGVIARLAEIDWSDVAVQGGYYDQPHFIREFRTFSGFSPSDYLNRRGPYLQHVPLPG